jgi:hypothetical protein
MTVIVQQFASKHPTVIDQMTDVLTEGDLMTRMMVMMTRINHTRP